MSPSPPHIVALTSFVVRQAQRSQPVQVRVVDERQQRRRWRRLWFPGRIVVGSHGRPRQTRVEQVVVDVVGRAVHRSRRGKRRFESNGFLSDDGDLRADHYRDTHVAPAVRMGFFFSSGQVADGTTVRGVGFRKLAVGRVKRECAACVTCTYCGRVCRRGKPNLLNPRTFTLSRESTPTTTCYRRRSRGCLTIIILLLLRLPQTRWRLA